MENRFKRYYPTIDNRIFSNYIRYDRLKDLILHEFANTEYANCNHVNIFIDIFDILRGIKYEEIENSNEYALASGIINMIAHYREYFRSRHATTTYVYIISSLNDNPSLRTQIHYYHSFHPNDDMSDEKMQYISKNIKVLESIVPYIPNAYFKHYTSSTTCAAIADIIDYNIKQRNDKSPNIIITRDIINFQLVNLFETPNIILRPKKSTVGNVNKSSVDMSFSINKQNLMSTLVYLRVNNAEELDQQRLKNRLDKVSAINPGLYSLFLAMTKVPERGYPSIMNIPSAINILYNILVEERLELNAYTTYPLNLLNLVAERSSNYKFNSTEIENRFRAIDSYYLLNNLRLTKVEEYRFVKDLYNPSLLKELNEKFFSEIPLDLNAL